MFIYIGCFAPLPLLLLDQPTDAFHQITKTHVNPCKLMIKVYDKLATFFLFETFELQITEGVHFYTPKWIPAPFRGCK